MHFAAFVLSIALAHSPGSQEAAQGAPAPQRPTFGCTAAEYRQFDFWVGEWNVYGAKQQLAGTNRITGTMDGCVIREEWRGVSGTAGGSLNIYNPVTRKWHQTWMDNTGLLLQLDGEFNNGAMQLVGPGYSPQGRTLNRVTWSAEPGAVRQVWEISADEGRSWKVVFDGTYRRMEETPSVK